MADSLLSRWLRMALALAVGGVALGIGAWLVLKPKGDLDALTGLVPAEASSAAFARGLDRWLQLATRTAQDPDASPELKRWLAERKAESEQRMGFDATDVRAWKKAGFEPDGTWGAVSLGVDPKAAQLFFFAPVHDAQAALATVQQALGKEGGKLEERKDAGRTLYAVSWPAEKAEGRPGAFAIAGAFLVLCDASGAALDAPASLRQLLIRSGEPTLREAEPFRAVRAELGERWAFMLYSAPAVTARLGQVFQGSPVLAGLGARGAGFAIDVAEDRITAKARVLNAPGWSAPFLGPVKAQAGDRVEGEPLAVARLSLNLTAFAELARKDERARNDLGRLALAFHDQLGLDLDQDVLGNLDGQVNAVALKPLDVHSKSVDGVLSAKVKDANRAAEALDHLADKLRSPLLPLVFSGTGPERWTTFGAVGGGLANGYLYLVVGDERARLVRTGLDPAQPGYTKHLSPAVNAGLQSGPAFYAYLDLGASAEALAARAGDVDPRAAELTRSLAAVSFGLDAREGALRADLDLFASSGGFSQAAKALAHATPDAGP